MFAIITVTATVTILIVLTGVYVAAEFATVTARQHKVHIGQMADAGNTLAGHLLPFLQDEEKLDDYVAACQLGITATSLVLGAYGQNTVANLLAPRLSQFENITAPVAFSISATAVLILLTLLQMIVSELLPKSLAVQYPERMALLMVYPIKWSLLIFRPFIIFFNGSGKTFLRLFGIQFSADQGNIHSLGEIERMVTDSHEGGLIDDKEQQMLRNAFRMRDLTARQVMVPRTRMITAPVESSVLEVLGTAIEGGFSRIPIYEETFDNVIGFVHIKDLFQAHLKGKELDLKELLRDVIYVPETLPIMAVWDKLNENRQYIAIVFDEYGGTEGLITFEDVIEEIFGELQDEFDEHEMALIYQDKEGRTHLRGDLLITDINEYLNLDLPYDEADTLGGLVFVKLGRPPRVGDETKFSDLVIRVEKITDLGISEISFQLPSGPFRIGEWEVAPHE